MIALDQVLQNRDVGDKDCWQLDPARFVQTAGTVEGVSWRGRVRPE